MIAETRFSPLEHVKLKMFDGVIGRIIRVILEHGNQPIYSVNFIIDGDFKQVEFYEDELENVDQ